MLLTNSVPDLHIFAVTAKNYQSLWLSLEPDEFALYGIGLIVLAIALLVAAFNVRRIPVGQTYVFFTFIAVIVATIVVLPSLVKFAQFYDYFLNCVVVTVGTVAISISIGCLAGYGLARYSGIGGVVILFAALAFRALPRMAFIRPITFSRISRVLYDTYALLIVTFVAINQPFAIWMLRSFFMEVPREIEEAAMIDCCNRFTGFIRVIVPISWPGIITTSLFTILLARLLTSSLWTLPVGISRFYQRQGYPLDHLVECERGIDNLANRCIDHLLSTEFGEGAGRWRCERVRQALDKPQHCPSPKALRTVTHH